MMDASKWGIVPMHTDYLRKYPNGRELLDPQGCHCGYYTDEAAAARYRDAMISGTYKTIEERVHLWLEFIGADELNEGKRRVLPEDIIRDVLSDPGAILAPRTLRAQVSQALKAAGLVSQRSRRAGENFQAEWVRLETVGPLTGRPARDPAVIAAAVRWLDAEGWLKPSARLGVLASTLGDAIFDAADGSPKSRELRAARVLKGLGFKITYSKIESVAMRRWRFVPPQRGPGEPAWSPDELMPEGHSY